VMKGGGVDMSIVYPVKHTVHMKTRGV